MSWLCIMDIVNAGSKSLENENYWAALSVALVLPSICARYDYQGDKFESKYWNEKNGKKVWQDRLAYVDWCNTVLFRHNGSLLSLVGHQGGGFLYDLRCSFAHEGVTDGLFGSNELQRYLILNFCAKQTVCVGDRLFVPVDALCSAIFDGIRNWTGYVSGCYLDTLFFDMEDVSDKRTVELFIQDERDKLLKQNVESHELRQKLKNGKNKEEQSNGNQ